MQRLRQIDRWKEKIIEWVREQEVDGKKLKGTSIKELNQTLKMVLEPDENAAKKLNGPCTKLLVISKKLPVHKVLRAAKQRMDNEPIAISENLDDGTIDLVRAKSTNTNISTDESTLNFEPLIDESLFEKIEVGDHCEGNMHPNCNGLNRVISALNNHQYLINGVQREDRNKLKRYPTQVLLNDYIHFVDYHADATSIEKIQNILQFKCESAKVCASTARHYRERLDVSNQDEKSEIHELSWSIDLIDSIHFMVYHLTELGLRISMEQLTGDLQFEITGDERDDSKLVDHGLKKMIKEIRMKRLSRYFKNSRLDDPNSKFTLQISTPRHYMMTATSRGVNINMTKRERVLEFIWRQIKDVSLRRKIYKFLDQHHFDTDCIDDDVEMFGDEKSCILERILGGSALTLLNSQWLPERIKEKRHERIMSASFATGYPLLYWKWYRTASMDDVTGSRLFSFIDFGGYTFEELSVDPHHENIKEEVLATGLMGPAKFESKVVQKAEKLLDSAKCRQIRSRPFGGDGGEDPLHFEIKWGSQLQPRHMQALVLYCDFTKLCKLLSKSLRKSKPTDGLKEIKNQNSMFFHFSKALREMVTYFGSDGRGKMNGAAARGPFFTGVNIVLNLSQFSIGLNVPTSTSITRAIALNFAGERGMLIVVGNQKGNSRQQPLFRANWVSAYPEEAECLWFGSIWRLSVEAISLVTKGLTLRASIAAVYLFDAALSGQKMQSLSVTKNSIEILDYCLKHMRYEATGPRPDAVNDYVLDTVYSFCQSKTKILLSLNQMNKTSANLQNMIYYGRSAQSRGRRARRRDNIFQAQLFNQFPNLVEMELWADELPLNIVSMLSVLEMAAIPESFKLLKIRDASQDWLERDFAAYVTSHGGHFKWNEERQIQLGERVFGITVKTINFVDWMFIKARKTLKQCTVEQIVTLFTFAFDGVFAQIEKMKTNMAEKLMRIVGWKEKIVEWIREQEIDGEIMEETPIKELNMTLRIKLEPDEKAAKRLNGPCSRMIKICKTMPVHKVLKAAKVWAKAAAMRKQDDNVNVSEITEKGGNEKE